MKSKSMSMKGYKIKNYLIKNKKFLKIMISAGIAIAVPLDPNLKLLIGAIGHMALSAIDFFLTEVEVKK